MGWINAVFRRSKKNCSKKKKAVIFGYKVNNPKEFSVIELEGDSKEYNWKAKKNIFKFSFIGLFYPNSVIKITNNIKPLKEWIRVFKFVFVKIIKFIWVSLEEEQCGMMQNHDNLLKIPNLIYNIQNRNTSKIACLGDRSKNKWIDKLEIKKF